ncbi:MAG TPA: alternative oxidase [Candidatus Omnitrophota bacterium]|nr:alternative oxidase [Candidatus Omnitrophota bacterium]HPS37548.1 alternative oxidase [Candidatus Omnitrophota bacterium]
MASYEYTMGKELDLKAEQERTLATPKLPANAILRFMFWQFDVLYGKPRSLPKVLVLEILARYPYWAWENGGYHLLSKLYSNTKKPDGETVEQALRHIQMGREAQDNEQWHMLLWADLCHQRGIRLNPVYHFLMPKVMTLVYFWITRIMYWLNPVWSFKMNAAFESHAEHEYMLYAQEHPEFEKMPVETEWFRIYPRQKSLADLVRRVGLDERDHMNHSLEEVERLTK